MVLHCRISCRLLTVQTSVKMHEGAVGAAALQGVHRLTPRDMKACTPHLAIISSPESLHLCQRCQDCPLSMQLVACEEPAASNQRLPVSLTDYHGHRHRHLLHWPLHSVTACCMAGLMRVVWTERCDLPLLKTCISLLRASVSKQMTSGTGAVTVQHCLVCRVQRALPPLHSAS